MSAIIAAEAMRRLPRMRSYGAYPRNTRFGDFHVSYDENLGELVARDAFLYAGSTRSTPPDPAALRRIAGYGSSSTVAYEGEGIYFLDKVRPGLWRLEVYPDAVPVRDPFEPPSPDKIVTRAISRAWPMTLALPDLGRTFTVQPVTAGNARTERAAGGRFTVTPGVYVLSATGPVDVATLPDTLGHVGFAEYHAPPPDTPAAVGHAAGRARRISPGATPSCAPGWSTRTPPDSACCSSGRPPAASTSGFAMRPAGGYEYAATVPAAALREGPHEFVITVFRGGHGVTFPGGLRRKPTDWDYYGRASWTVDVVGPRTPLRLFDPAIGRGAARVHPHRRRRAPRALPRGDVRGHRQAGLPCRAAGGLERGWSPADYTASLVIADRVAARRETIAGAECAAAAAARSRVPPGLACHADGGRRHQLDRGRAGGQHVDASSHFRSRPSSSVVACCFPRGFPASGTTGWDRRQDVAARRTVSGLDHLERLQLSLRREDGGTIAPEGYGVEVEWVSLEFGGDSPTSHPERSEGGTR